MKKMKKLLLSLALVAFMGTGAWAQEQKAKVSLNVCPQWSANTGVKAGVDLYIPFGQSHWGFEPGLNWSFRNVTSEQVANKNQLEYNDKVHYLDLPLRLAVRVAGREAGPFNLSLLFGPYLAYGLGGTSHYTLTKEGQITQGEADAFSDEGRLESRFDYGLNLGANALIQQHIQVGLFTEIGLKGIYKQNSVAEVLIGDLFGVTKINLCAGVSVGYRF